jgi:hypothetical protein
VFDMSPEFRHQLAADRMASLRRSAESSPARPLRRAVGAGLARLRLTLGDDSRGPRSGSLPGTDTASPATTAVFFPGRDRG